MQVFCQMVMPCFKSEGCHSFCSWFSFVSIPYLAFDIKALVISLHQFVYTDYIPCGNLVVQPASFRSSFAKHLPARCSFIFGNCARSRLYGGCSKMCQWNYSHCKACVFWAMCGCAFSCNRTITRECLPLRQDNLKSHRPAENK